MIYLFYGSDIAKARAKAFEWVAKARAKEPALAYVRLEGSELTDSALEEAVSAGGLFVRRLLVLIDNPFPPTRAKSDEAPDIAEEDARTSVLAEHLEALAGSDNAIVILAPKLAAAEAKKLVAKAAKAYEYTASPAREARIFNANLVNALAAREREKLWLEIVKALRAGDPPEMLSGLLHWKARDLLAKGSRRWSAVDARALSLRLIALIQDSRAGGLGLACSLERFALSL